MTDQPTTTDAGIQVGVISPGGGNPFCSICQEPVDRDLHKAPFPAKEEESLRPLFCMKCDSWFHPACLGQSSSGRSCPTCSKRSSLKTPYFYCLACNRAPAIRDGGRWPSYLCANCGGPASLAVITDVIGMEAICLVLLGIVSGAAFIIAASNDFPQPFKVTTRVLAAIFALPWLLLLLAGVLKSMMPSMIDIGSVGDWSGGVDNILLGRARIFRSRPAWYRFGKIYTWVFVNGLSAAVTIAIGIAVIEFITNMARANGH